METVVDEEDQGKKAPMMYAVYLSDETQMLEWKQKVEDEKLVAALIYLYLEEKQIFLLGGICHRNAGKGLCLEEYIESLR